MPPRWLTENAFEIRNGLWCPLSARAVLLIPALLGTANNACPKLLCLMLSNDQNADSEVYLDYGTTYGGLEDQNTMDESNTKCRSARSRWWCGKYGGGGYDCG